MRERVPKRLRVRSEPVWAGVVPVHLAAEPSEYDWRRVQDGRLGRPRTGRG